MPDYRPVPGQSMMESGPSSDMPMDDLTMMAKERASNLLMPYAGMASPTGASPNPATGATAASPGMPGAGSPGVEDKLYQAIHPDTFNKIMETIMQFVTGKPIPRQGGGPVDPDKQYVVGENGPETFKPTIPGEIIPGKPIPTPMGPIESPGRSLAYGGRNEPSQEWPGLGPQVYRGIKRTMTSPYDNPYEPGLPNFQMPGETTPTMKLNAQGVYEIPTGGESTPSHTPVPVGGVSLPGGGEEAASTHFDPTTGFQGYGGWTERETPATMTGDQAARQRILQEAGQAGFRPIPGQSYLRSYYEAHPEERAMDQARADNQELMNMFKTAKTPGTRAAIGKLIETNIGAAEKIGVAGMEQGAGSPVSQERLAHAESLRGAPAAHMEAVKEQTRAHLEGVNKQVEGHLAAAKIASETKDPIMKEVGTLLAQGQKNAEMYGTPFNPQETIASTLGVYRAMGAISDEQWNKLPKEYKPPIQGAKLAPDGNWYVPDPKRKGKYLRVE